MTTKAHSLYYHRTSFANFVAVASNLEAFPKVKLWYFSTCLRMYVWFYCSFKRLANNTTYWTMSAKCVTLHNSACYQIFRLCEHLRILMYTNVYYPRLYITFQIILRWIAWDPENIVSGPLKRDNLDVVWKSASTCDATFVNTYYHRPTFLQLTTFFAIAFRGLKSGPNLLMFSWYFFLTLLLHDHDFLGISRWTESLELDDTYC